MYKRKDSPRGGKPFGEPELTLPCDYSLMTPNAVVGPSIGPAIQTRSPR